MGLLTFQTVQMKVMAPHIARMTCNFERCKEHGQPPGVSRLNALCRALSIKLGQAFMPKRSNHNAVLRMTQRLEFVWPGQFWSM